MSAETVEYEGRAVTIKALAAARGMSYDTLKSRLLRGWSVERALTTPTRAKRGAGFRRRRLGFGRGPQ